MSRWENPEDNILDILRDRLTMEKKRLIHNNDFIGIDTMRVLIEYGKTTFIMTDILGNSEQTGGNSGNSYDPWRGEAPCERCGEVIGFELSKTKLCDYIKRMKSNNGIEDYHIKNNDKSYIICQRCIDDAIRLAEEQDRKKREQAAIMVKKYKKIVDGNTQYFIDNFLNPHRHWDGMNAKQRYSAIRDFGGKHSYCRYQFDENIIASFIKSMDYYDFLKTPYWIAISGKVKLDAKYKCKMCPSRENLNTHHPSYDIHGYEMQNIKDLVCLCGSCHSKFHNK